MTSKTPHQGVKPALEDTSPPRWMTLKTWAVTQGLGFANASRLARVHRITTLGCLPGGAFVVGPEGRISKSPQGLLELDWNRLKIERYDYPHLEQAALEVNVPILRSRGALYAPTEHTPPLLGEFKRVREAAWHADRLAKTERSLAWRGLSRPLLEGARMSFSGDEWSMLQMRYALGEATRVHSVEEVALAINRTSERVARLERGALLRLAQQIREGEAQPKAVH